MQRREFLKGAAAAATAGFVVRPSTAGAMARQSKQAALDRISIMSLNFDRMMKIPDAQPSPERTLEFFDFPKMIADTYGVHKVEYQHYHLASLEPAYLRDLKSACDRAKVQPQQFNLEFSTLNMSAPRVRDRLLAIDLTKAFVDHAVAIGAKRVMANQGTLTTVNKDDAIATLKTMADYGKSKSIIVSVETRGSGGGVRGRAGQPPPPPIEGLPARGVPTWMLLADVIRSAGAYSNVDVGGAAAANQEDLHACLKTMFPFTANTMHTRVSQAWDLATVIRFLEKDLGYKGLYTIEASNGHEGTKEIYDVVVATLTAL
jgi:hypothetical protein